MRVVLPVITPSNNNADHNLDLQDFNSKLRFIVVRMSSSLASLDAFCWNPATAKCLPQELNSTETGHMPCTYTPSARACSCSSMHGQGGAGGTVVSSAGETTPERSGLHGRVKPVAGTSDRAALAQLLLSIVGVDRAAHTAGLACPSRQQLLHQVPRRLQPLNQSVNYSFSSHLRTIRCSTLIVKVSTHITSKNLQLIRCLTVIFRVNTQNHIQTFT